MRFRLCSILWNSALVARQRRLTQTWRGPGTKMRIQVEQHADHRGIPMLLKLHFGEHQVDVLEVLDQWYGPDYRYIKVRGCDGGLYILRFDEPHADWALTMFISDERARVRGA